MWPDGTHPLIFYRMKCVCIPSIRSIAPFFLPGKSIIFSFLIQKWVWPYRHAHDIHLVILILNIYGFVGLSPTVQASFVDTQRDKQTDEVFILL